MSKSKVPPLYEGLDIVNKNWALEIKLNPHVSAKRFKWVKPRPHRINLELGPLSIRYFDFRMLENK